MKKNKVIRKASQKKLLKMFASMKQTDNLVRNKEFRDERNALRNSDPRHALMEKMTNYQLTQMNKAKVRGVEMSLEDVQKFSNLPHHSRYVDFSE